MFLRRKIQAGPTIVDTFESTEFTYTDPSGSNSYTVTHGRSRAPDKVEVCCNTHGYGFMKVMDYNITAHNPWSNPWWETLGFIVGQASSVQQVSITTYRLQSGSNVPTKFKMYWFGGN
jgi:hypothetical protein